MKGLPNIRKPKKASAPQGDEALREQTPRKGKRKPGGKRKGSISTIIMVIILVVGLGIIAYPTFSDWWNSFHQSRAIANYVSTVEEMDPQLVESMLNAAHDYNVRLLEKPDRYKMSDEERAEYNSLLNPTGTGIMGYINIPSIGVNLPIYHGTEETALQVAIGHIEGSSLPVGGPSTHAVVTGHRGLPSARLFTDLDRLVEGDTFTITVLNQVLTYQIDQIRIVLPEDTSELSIQEGADYVTLITCTPYGINTHRMLVRGHRIENLSDQVTVPAEATQIPVYMAILAVAIPLLFVYLLGALIYLRRRHPDLDTEKALEAVRKHAESLEDAATEGEPTAEAEGNAITEDTAPELDAAPESEATTEDVTPESDSTPEVEDNAKPEDAPEPDAALEDTTETTGTNEEQNLE